jgi:hypothetical protein
MVGGKGIQKLVPGEVEVTTGVEFLEPHACGHKSGDDSTQALRCVLVATLHAYNHIQGLCIPEDHMLSTRGIAALRTGLSDTCLAARAGCSTPCAVTNPHFKPVWHIHGVRGFGDITGGDLQA